MAKLKPEAGVEVFLVGHHVELVHVLHRPLSSLAIFLPCLSNLCLRRLGSLRKIRLEWMVRAFDGETKKSFHLLFELIVNSGLDSDSVSRRLGLRLHHSLLASHLDGVKVLTNENMRGLPTFLKPFC